MSSNIANIIGSLANNNPDPSSSIGSAVAGGIEHIYSYDIALAVILMVLFLSLAANFFLLNAVLKFKDIGHTLLMAVSTLNERLNHHD